MKQTKKIMSLITVLKAKVKRSKDSIKDLEILIDDKTATPRQKEEYIKLKAKIEAWEDAIDLAEGMID